MDGGQPSVCDYIRSFNCEEINYGALFNILQEICDENKYLLSPDEAMPDDCTQKLVDIFCTLNLSRKVGKMVLQTLVPQTEFNNDLIRPFIFWLLEGKNRDKDLASDLLLWFSKLLEYKKIEVTSFKAYYGLLIHFLSLESKLIPVCYFLMATAHPKFITKRVVQVAEHHYQFYEDENIAALLHLYSKIHPDFIKVPLSGKLRWPRISIDSSIERAFRMAKPKNINIFCRISELPSESYELSSRVDTDCLPPPFYCQTLDPGCIKCIDITSIEELGKNLDKIMLPNNSLSLLNSRIGFHLLALRQDVHNIFLVDLSWQLGNTSDSRYLLSKIATFQEFFQQGLPPIYIYLSEYLLTWDGVEDRTVILRLLSWVHFNTFGQLCAQLLSPIIRLFVTSEAEMKVAILNSIGKLIINMNLLIKRSELKFEPLFGCQQPHWLKNNPLSTLYQLVVLTVRLIRRTLVSEFKDNRSPSLYLFNAIHFFELVSFLELKYDVPQFTVITPEIGYSSLFTRNIAVLSKLCSLLVRYKKVAVPCLERKGIANEYSAQIDALSKLSADLSGFLWKGKEGSHLSSCLLLEDMPKEIVVKANAALELKDSMTVRRHEAIVAMVTLLALKASRNPDSLSDSEWMLFLKNFAGGIFDFVEEFK